MSSQRPNKVRKRKTNLELKLNEFELDNAEAIEMKLRKVAEKNELTEEEIHKMVKKIVRNKNVLALVTLNGENNEIVNKSNENEQRAIIITETLSVPKLTRLKAKLNNVPGMLRPATTSQYETTTLINEDLCSDEDDGEYLFQEEDFMSDDEPSMTTSDVDSNPCTPRNSQYAEDSPVKLTDDGCFKIPCDRKDETTDDLRISTRTRSKVCLEKVAIEDIESEFVPPDVEYLDVIDHDITANDTEWMEFLNEFSRPLNSSAFVEDDDPINDPEYVATEKVPVDAEELRPVNISKKELADLFAELLDDLGNDGISLENINLQQPVQKLANNQDIFQNYPNTFQAVDGLQTVSPTPCTIDTTTTVTSPCTLTENNVLQIATNTNCHNNDSPTTTNQNIETSTEASIRPTVGIKTQKLHSMQYFEDNNNVENDANKFSHLQYELLQQQLRIHIQMLTQTFLQTYFRPDLWQLAPQAKNMLLELDKLAQNNINFMACNLPNSLALIKTWEEDLSVDNNENKQLMSFLHKEIDANLVKRRQVQRFPERLMDLVLNSNVFLYPQYLPRLPFSSKICSYHVFAPTENQLIAMGLEKNMKEIEESNENLPKRSEPLIIACDKLSGDTIFGKQKRRIWDHVKVMRNIKSYNPIKYFFEHNSAPAVEHKLLPCDILNMKLPKERFDELPLTWQKYISKTQKQLKSTTIKDKNPNNLFDNLKRPLSPCNSIKTKTTYRKNTKRKPLIACFQGILKRNSSVSRVKVKKTKCSPRFKSAINKYKKLNNLWRLRNNNNFKRRIRLSLNSPKRHRPLLQQHIKNFLKKCKKQQQIQEFPYSKNILILRVYCRFKALDLYSSLLEELKMICTGEAVVSKANCLNKRRRASGSQNATNAAAGQQHNFEEDGGPVIRNKKSTRQEENFRHMLMPETPEDLNRKDAVFAYNFYERVEEIFTSENRLHDLKKFNKILNAFDPSQEKVADLFHSMEELFMPKHPELAEVFLSFLLPAEASEVGKFFEHFMINNVTTFISKLNIYFNKQPAQIKKIYNCLSDLAAEPDVTLQRVEMKILPLLKGNQFLIEWFQAQFPNAMPPERLLPEVEQINMKEKNHDGEIYETVVDALYSPTNESPTSCQLRYINGRIYYGSKLTLPVKLSFLATHLNDKNNQVSLNNDNDIEVKRQKLLNAGCVHGIREEGELCLAAEAHHETTTESPRDENSMIADNLLQGMQTDLSGKEHEEVLNDIKEENDIEYEVCDQSAMRAHAIRLNPQYYACFATNASHVAGNLNASGNINSHSLGKKFYVEDAGDTSPRKKHINSPTKKTKSPVAAARRPQPPMVVIPKPNLAIACAKKLKSLVEHEDECKTSKSTICDLSSTHVHTHIIARPKKLARTDACGKSDISENHTTKPITKSERVQQKHVDEQIASKAIVDVAVDTTTTNNAANEEEKYVCTSPKANNANQAWLREEDKVILMEMRVNSKDQHDLLLRIHNKLPNRNLDEIRERFVFLMDFLSSLQRK